ncbi:MAG: hypothetical protein WKG01_08515 [Kofleriaceae bacterium]
MKHTAIVAFAILVSTPALADKDWTLEEKGWFEQIEKELAQYVNLAGKDCDTTFKLELDKPTFKSAWNGNGKTGVDNLRMNFLAQPAREVRNVCLEGKTQKAAVKQGIKTIRVGFAAPPTQSLKAGTLAVGVPKEGQKRSWESELRAFIKKSL